MTFSRQILIGLFSGTLAGVFFGERTSAIAWVADGFVKLLQMMVLPYITVSIIASLGSLKPAELRTLGLRTAAVVGGLWIVALAFAFLVPLTFPHVQSASFFSTSLVERRAPFDFLALYVPANPFNALANNVVPAVVLFSIVLGCALVGIDGRERLLEVLTVARAAITRATRFVTRLTPYGLFAIAATAAGTLDLQQLERLQIYLVAYVAVALLVSLWVLPGLVGALTPIRGRDLLRESQDSLITAAIAGDLFIVLPGLTQSSRALLARPDLLILDEPTNHLDTSAIEWLEDFLARYRGTCLFVTHDRYFLDRVATRVVELARGEFFSYPGNYTRYRGPWRLLFSKTFATRSEAMELEKN